MARTPGGIPPKDWAMAQRIGRKRNVDPLLLVAIGITETNWGKAGDGRKGNILGVGSYDSGSSYKWKGVHGQLSMGSHLLDKWGARTIKDVQAGKASQWATDPGWESTVGSVYKRISKGGYSRNVPKAGVPKAPTQQVVTPAVDNSAARQQVLGQTLAVNHPFKLSNLLSAQAQLGQLGDVPAVTKTVTAPPRGAAPVGGDVRVANAQPGLTLSQIIARGVKADRINQQGRLPYAWGGGHGSSPAKIGTPVDCSGFVSQLLGIAPRVSGDFEKWGRPGRGKNLTVWANGGHVLLSVRDPRTGKVRWFATSHENKGGGAGERSAPSASYLADFVPRHAGAA